jgi:hypothetical protein
LERLATACVSAPGAAHFHERPVINWFVLGFPRHVAAEGLAGQVNTGAADDNAARAGAQVRIIHSPSQLSVKGTAQIKAAVERLQRRGFNLEFVMLQGMANAEVLAALRRCDLVVDQLYSDTPMAGLATEAAILGKPVLVAGYLARDMPGALGGAPVPPTRFVTPERFEEALEELVSSDSMRTSLATAAFQFVQSEWSCQQVAGRLLRILRQEAPANWWFNPANVRYLAGCGLSEDAGRKRVRELIDYGGVAALQLADKPTLEQAFVDWACAPAPTDMNFDRAVP